MNGKLTDRLLNRILAGVMAVHLLVRLLIALFTDLGVDEAYYVQYALYPDWSYFDHPPLVGWLIWLTTAGVRYADVFFVRLGPLLLGTSSLFLVYRTGTLIRNRLTGLAAMLLAGASFYHTIIAGTFILPDTTLSVCWLLALYAFISYLKWEKLLMLWSFGLAAGMALLSKYHGLALVAGVILYWLLTDYRKLLSWRFFPSVLLPLILFAPVIYWNLQHGLISARFHGARVGNDAVAVHWHFLGQEIVGQLFYHNPVSVLWILVVLGSAYGRKRYRVYNKPVVFLLCCSLPLIGCVLGLSLFNKTLPHWSGPAYYGLILAAVCVFTEKKSFLQPLNIWKQLRWPVYVALFVLSVGLLQIRYGFIPMPEQRDTNRLGMHDFTLDLFGWDQVAEQFDEMVEADREQGHAAGRILLVTGNWFPAGQLDFYLGFSKGRTLLVDGGPEQQHQYIFINEWRGGLKQQEGTTYYLSTSHYFYEPSCYLKERYQVTEPYALTVMRQGEPVYSVYVYRLEVHRR